MMEGDSQLSCSDEYLLLEKYCQTRKNTGTSGFVARHTNLRLPAKSGNEKFGYVAEKLTYIVDNELLGDDGIESDNASTQQPSDDPVINKLVELLKQSGDDLNKKILEDREFIGTLQQVLSYDFFGRLTKAFIGSVATEYLQDRCTREQIALTFEVTSRLKGLDLHPMNRIMGYGAQFLQKNFAPWVKQHGGWDKVFGEDDDEEVH